MLYSRKPALAKTLAGLHENPDYVPGIALNPALDATCEPAEALAGTDLVALAVPAQSLRANLAAWAPLIPPGALLVSLMKGIELGTCRRMSEVLTEVLGADTAGRGLSVAQATAATNQTAEGVASCGPVLELARAHHVEMPITELVQAVMHDGLPVAQAASMLASRSAKPEWYG